MKTPMNQVAISIVLCLGSTLAFSQAEETFDYTVREGDTCVKIAQRVFGDRSRYDLIHAYNPGMGPPPHDLVPGTTLVLPRRALDRSEVPDAHVTDVRREVRASEPDEVQWRLAERGLGLFGGWRVNTHEASAAELTFRDTSVLQMRENTLVVIFTGTAGSARQRSSRAELRSGALRSRLGSLRMAVDLPSGNAALGGGSSVVDVDEEGTTRVSHHDGAPVRLAGDDGTAVPVPAGRGSKVRPRQRPTPPRPLPPAPEWEAVPSAFVGLAGNGATLRGAWTEVGDARFYRLEVLRGEALFAALEVPAEVTRFEMHGVPGGQYSLRVASIDGDFFESRPSEPTAIDVMLLDVRPPGASDVEDRPLPDPSQPPAEPRVLIGSTIASSAPAVCASDATEGESAALRLATAGRVTVRCRRGDQAYEPMDLEVVSPTMAHDGSEGQPLEVERGRARSVRIALSSPLPVPEGASLRGEGVELRNVTREGEVFVADIVSHDTAGGWIVLHLGDVELARHRVRVREELPEPTPTVPIHPQEALATLRYPGLLALRDPAPRSALRMSLGVGLTRSREGESSYSMGLFLDAAIAERVRLHVGYNQALGGEAQTSEVERPFTGLGAVLVDSSVALRAELGAWWPSSRSDLPAVFAPAFDFGVTFNEERLLFRTRQGALLALDDGPLLWASAYGLDLCLGGPISFGTELNASVGRDRRDDERLTNVALALVLSADAGPMTIGFAVQRALTHDLEQARGPWRAQLTLGVAVDDIGE